MAAGEVNKSVSFFETEVTFTFTSCSRVKFSRSPEDLASWLVPAASATAASSPDISPAPDKIHFRNERSLHISFVLFSVQYRAHCARQGRRRVGFGQELDSRLQHAMMRN